MFDTEQFIREMERRPALYNMALKEYRNRELKIELWKEIGCAMYDTWDDMSDHQQTELERGLQTKWKSLRDHFRKEVSIMKNDLKTGKKGFKKRKYVFYEQLRFLIPILENSKGRSSNLTEQIDEAAESSDTVVDFEGGSHSASSDQEEPTASTATSYSQPLKAKKRCVPSHNKIAIGNNDIKTITNILYESVALQKEARLQDPMGNKSFLMSLLPLMDKMSQEEVINIRLGIMQLFQNSLNIKNEQIDDNTL